jgi:hypothetical protein
MRRHTRQLEAALLAMLALALTTGIATANRSIGLRGEGERGETVQSSTSSLTFNSSELSASTAIICAVTLLRQITRNPIPKVAETTFGRVVGIAIDIPNCRNGSAFRRVNNVTALEGEARELGNGVRLYSLTGGWELVYDGFEGFLPEITGISFHIARTRFLIELSTSIGNIECLYEGSAYGTITVERRRVVSAAAVLELTRLTRVRGNVLCPSNGTFNGNFVTPTISIALL